MDAVIAAVGHPERLRVVLWLLSHGEARQSDILQGLELERGERINPGTMSGLLKPLLDAGVLERRRPRGPIAVRDPRRTLDLLRAAASIHAQHAEASTRSAGGGFAALRQVTTHAAAPR